MALALSTVSLGQTVVNPGGTQVIGSGVTGGSGSIIGGSCPTGQVATAISSVGVPTCIAAPAATVTDASLAGRNPNFGMATAAQLNSTTIIDPGVSSSTTQIANSLSSSAACAGGTSLMACELMISSFYGSEYSNVVNAPNNGAEDLYHLFPTAGGIGKPRLFEDRRTGRRHLSAVNSIPFTTYGSYNDRSSFIFESRTSNQFNYADNISAGLIWQRGHGFGHNFGLFGLSDKANFATLMLNSRITAAAQGGGTLDSILTHTAPGDDMVFTVQHDTDGCSEGEDECDKLFRAFLETTTQRFGGTLASSPTADAGFGNYTIHVNVGNGYSAKQAGEDKWLVNLSRGNYSSGNIAAITFSSYPGLASVAGDASTNWLTQFGASKITSLTAAIDAKTYNTSCPSTVLNSANQQPNPFIVNESGVGGIAAFCATVGSTVGMTDGMSCTIAGNHSNLEQVKLVHVFDATHATFNVQLPHESAETLSCGGAQGYAFSKTQDDLTSIPGYPTQPQMTLHKYWPIVGSDSSGNLLLYMNSAIDNELTSTTYQRNTPRTAATVTATAGGGGIASVTVTNGGTVNYQVDTTNVPGYGQRTFAAPTLTFPGCSVQPTYQSTLNYSEFRWQPTFTILTPGTCSSTTVTAQSVYPLPYKIAPMAMVRKTVDPATGSSTNGTLIVGNLNPSNWQSGDTVEIPGHVHDHVGSTRFFGKYYTGASSRFGIADNTTYGGDWASPDTLKGVTNQTDGHKYYATTAQPVGPGVAYEDPPNGYGFAGNYSAHFPLSTPPKQTVFDIDCNDGGLSIYHPCLDGINSPYDLFRMHSSFGGGYYYNLNFNPNGQLSWSGRFNAGSFNGVPIAPMTGLRFGNGSSADTVATPAQVQAAATDPTVNSVAIFKQASGGSDTGLVTPTAGQDVLEFVAGHLNLVKGASAPSQVCTADGTNCPSSVAISNVQVALPTTAIAANTCTTAATVTMTGVATTSAFSSAFATNPNAVTGWGASGGLTFTAWPTTNTLNWSVCNQSSASITPGAMTLNVGAR